jgi:alpha-L-fucosidase 2
MKKHINSNINSLFVGLIFLSLNALSQTNATNRSYEIWDDSPAQNRGNDFTIVKADGYPFDQDWESESYPIGNGYMGANIFGRTDTERIQITEKTLANEGLYGFGGLTSFSETYLEFNHKNVKNYKRSLSLNDAILYVNYESNGVQYKREYLANYPDNVIAIRLSADKKGKISFNLRPEIPYLKNPEEKNAKSGKTFAENDLITLSGNIPHFNVNYEGQIKVINEGGKRIAKNAAGKSEIAILNANSVVLLIATGTNYKLSDKIFLEETDNKKLDVTVFPHDNVSNLIKSATDKGFEVLKESHLKDYQKLFSRVNLILSPEKPKEATKTILQNYKNGNYNTYLEELMFHYGRYLLIASSRAGTLPSGLQGVWSQYAVTPWTGGYWHNINVQMNYWGAFNANLAETFVPYLEYFKAYQPKASLLATGHIKWSNPKELDLKNDDNGWAIGTGATAYRISNPGGHSGPGTGGFTTKLLWDYYDFTRDTSYLLETGYPALMGMSKFLSKTLKYSDYGILLVEPSSSPEQSHKGQFYNTKGTTFDQAFVWETYNDLLKAAKMLNKKDDFLKKVSDQIIRLDPILIGTSGQVKEYREEKEYGEIGDKMHRHTSQLCALYPGTLINSSKPKWIDGVSKSLDLRLDDNYIIPDGEIYGAYTEWALAHRMNLRARTKEAEKARIMYSRLLKEFTAPNLWTICGPFQIDGNLGAMAGVVEMLLQSHEDFIELLPSLPKAWNKGEFKGLVARGNFEIATRWENSTFSSLEIRSNSGGSCILKLPNTTNLKIKDGAGNIISFIKEGQDKINFETRKATLYYISLHSMIEK